MDDPVIKERCPFCGYYGVLSDEGYGRDLVECGRCGAIGPHDETTTTEENVAAWDTRTPAEQMTPEALDQCPFCGGEAVWREDDGRLNVPFGLVVDHAYDCFLGDKIKPFQKEGILAAWNRRLVREDIRPEVEDDEYPSAWTISKRRHEEKQRSYGSRLPPMADKEFVEQVIADAAAQAPKPETAEMESVMRQAVFRSTVHLYDAQPETAEPVAWMYKAAGEPYFATERNDLLSANSPPDGEWIETPLFAHPQQTEVVEALVQLLAETRFRAAKEMREMIGGDEIADMPTLLWKARQDVEATLKGSRP